MNDIIKWVLGVITSVGFLSGIGYLMRDTIGRYFSKAVEHKFEKKIEKFKADIRESEKELEQIRGYIYSARSGRDSIIQSKKFEAAENLIKIRQYLYGFNLVCRYLQMIKVEELYNKSDDANVKSFIHAIVSPLNLDAKFEEYNKFDKDTPKLYLSEKTIKTFEIFEGINMTGAAALKMLEFSSVTKSNLITAESLVKKIVELVPWSKELFEKHGENYVYYWNDYFYYELLKEIRNDLSGDGNMIKDTERAAKLALDFRETQSKLQESLNKFGLSTDLVRTDEGQL
ncbi:Uncharacterised protein [Enterobacter cloacae]|uniref:hypothetical protein n=1 Tax=Enterobacter asburiae TaxID=61645 RepID=UPI000798346F|nr:hypothetical protein AI2797V1_3446 [Enterobacter cloacae]CAE7821052.1 hypothetical protein AI2802V1_3431 [Enterobacter cloacae]CAH3819795.1 hypothetical protein AI2797V1_3446 [Enterobacter cloacae]CAH4004179.1 hypothetical protein AI2802V1_3431 [Enterobacter cloacae]SAE78085.1 Uncharacterised protein [Enterobacter cloacae]